MARTFKVTAPKKETKAAAYNQCVRCERRFYAGTVKRDAPICGICQPIDGSYTDDDGMGTVTLVTPWSGLPQTWQAREREKELIQRNPEAVDELGEYAKRAPLRDGTQIWDAELDDE